MWCIDRQKQLFKHRFQFEYKISTWENIKLLLGMKSRSRFWYFLKNEMPIIENRELKN